MFERKGRTEGARDGQDDALADRPAKPRPSAAMAILSQGYMEAYFTAYRAAHAAHRRVIDRRRAEAAVREAHLATQRSEDSRAHDLLAERRRDQELTRAQGGFNR